MQLSKLQRLLPNLLPLIAAAIIALIPFHAVLTVWLSQFVGHYMLLRLWKEALLIVLVLGALYTLVKDVKARRLILASRLVWLIVAYLGVQAVWGLTAYATHQVSFTALGYGWISNTRFLIFFLAVLVIVGRSTLLQRLWPRLVLWPAAIVAAFGMLQYFVLPYDFMRLLGYSRNTIFPYEDINYNINYIRIMSTLRGANPLGAYLVVVLGLLMTLWRQQRHRWYVLLGGASVVALVLTFSRSAWIGFVASAAFLVWAGVRSRRTRQLLLVVTILCLVIGGSAIFSLRHDVTLQNALLHTQENTAAEISSNQGHAIALQDGLADVLHQPLGRGPGTAGPASLYNQYQGGRIAENYFLQVGQEVGWLGLAIFIGINTYIGLLLWRIRTEPLALGLLAALIGISIVNLFSHAWTDDTLAYLWWGLAAIALAPAAQTESKKHGK